MINITFDLAKRLASSNIIVRHKARVELRRILPINDFENCTSEPNDGGMILEPGNYSIITDGKERKFTVPGCWLNCSEKLDSYRANPRWTEVIPCCTFDFKQWLGVGMVYPLTCKSVPVPSGFMYREGSIMPVKFHSIPSALKQ